MPHSRRSSRSSVPLSRMRRQWMSCVDVSWYAEHDSEQAHVENARLRKEIRTLTKDRSNQALSYLAEQFEQSKSERQRLQEDLDRFRTEAAVASEVRWEDRQHSNYEDMDHCGSRCCLPPLIWAYVVAADALTSPPGRSSSEPCAPASTPSHSRRCCLPRSLPQGQANRRHRSERLQGPCRRRGGRCVPAGQRPCRMNCSRPPAAGDPDASGAGWVEHNKTQNQIARIVASRLEGIVLVRPAVAEERLAAEEHRP